MVLLTTNDDAFPGVIAVALFEEGLEDEMIASLTPLNSGDTSTVKWLLSTPRSGLIANGTASDAITFAVNELGYRGRGLFEVIVNISSEVVSGTNDTRRRLSHGRRLFWNDIGRAFENIGKEIGGAFEDLGDEIAGVVSQLGDLIEGAWNLSPVKLGQVAAMLVDVVVDAVIDHIINPLGNFLCSSRHPWRTHCGRWANCASSLLGSASQTRSTRRMTRWLNSSRSHMATPRS